MNNKKTNINYPQLIYTLIVLGVGFLGGLYINLDFVTDSVDNQCKTYIAKTYIDIPSTDNYFNASDPYFERRNNQLIDISIKEINLSNII